MEEKINEVIDYIKALFRKIYKKDSVDKVMKDFTAKIKRLEDIQDDNSARQLDLMKANTRAKEKCSRDVDRLLAEMARVAEKKLSILKSNSEIHNVLADESVEATRKIKTLKTLL